MNKYLKSTPFIDWRSENVAACARSLSIGLENKNDIAKVCFEYVRDQIFHSGDHKLNPVTTLASEVLTHKTGYCFAKSHLLAALLRANDIPAALAYQRVSLGGSNYGLHGLNAVYLKERGWRLIDARGNREDINVEFSLDSDCFAFECDGEGEIKRSSLYAEPLDVVTEALLQLTCWRDVEGNLPDSIAIAIER